MCPFTQKLTRRLSQFTLFPIFLALVIANRVLIPNFEMENWSPQQRIPGYENNTWPPILIADQNRTVHAFSYQWLSAEDGTSVRPIEYNKWTQEQGWSTPVDILISPLKNDARLLDAFLDQSGNVHVIFWGGDNTQANIYYSNAPISDAANARSWSTPTLVAENAGDPENGQFYVEKEKELSFLFSGREDGNGLYTTSSDDLGVTWSKPDLVTRCNDPVNFVNNLKVFKANSGQIVSIWNEVNPGGQGRGIYFSKYLKDVHDWNNPKKLAEAETGYGTNTPAIIVYQDAIFAFYNLGGFIWQRTSTDDGQNWTSPKQIYANHVGVNGSLSLVVDSKDGLHMLFGQRIPGSPDIHGMWHSNFLGMGWSEPDAVVSGPTIPDVTGNKAFDPYEAHAVVSQGNIILVTWRSDPGLKGNGVWFSNKVLDAPELPVITPAQALPVVTTNQVVTETPLVVSTTTVSSPEITPINAEQSDSSSLSNNPTDVLVISIIPVFLFIAVVIIRILWFSKLTKK
jgi:hypothetical protein